MPFQRTTTGKETLAILYATGVLVLTITSFRCLAVISSVLGRAGEMGQKRRLKDAKEGIVRWQMPLEIRRFLEIQTLRAEWTQRAKQEALDEETKSIEREERSARQNARNEELAVRAAMREFEDEELNELIASDPDWNDKT
jgi:hypothetical protein